MARHLDLHELIVLSAHLWLNYVRPVRVNHVCEIKSMLYNTYVKLATNHYELAKPFRP
jgi:hypothetical protein